MKIGFITDKIYPYYIGGYETRYWELAKRLAEDHELHVFTSCPKNTVIKNIHFHKMAPYFNYVNDNGYRLLGNNLLYSFLLYKKLYRYVLSQNNSCNKYADLKPGYSYLIL